MRIYSVWLSRHGGGERVINVHCGAMNMGAQGLFLSYNSSNTEQNQKGSNCKQSSLQKVTVKSNFL